MESTAGRNDNVFFSCVLPSLRMHADICPGMHCPRLGDDFFPWFTAASLMIQTTEVLGSSQVCFTQHTHPKFAPVRNHPQHPQGEWVRAILTYRFKKRLPSAWVMNRQHIRWMELGHKKSQLCEGGGMDLRLVSFFCSQTNAECPSFTSSVFFRKCVLKPTVLQLFAMSVMALVALRGAWQHPHLVFLHQV